MRKIGKQNPELNMFEEMRLLSTSDKTISPAEILRMATINGARALGLAGQIGELTKGASADLIAIPADSKSDVYETLLAHSDTVAASMIDGQWVIPPRT
ncbi:MAG: amidohydrolase family protein [Limisphaerales bacterium]